MSGDALTLLQETTEAKRSTVVRVAREWINTPYQAQQSTKGVACDCAGLLIGVAKETGIVAPDFEQSAEWAEFVAYTSRPDGRLLDACYKFMDPVRFADLLPSDLIVMRSNGEPSHLAIVVGTAPLSVVHASSISGIVETVIDPQTRRRAVVACFRFRGL